MFEVMVALKSKYNLNTLELLIGIFGEEVAWLPELAKLYT
jgi:hypothetical protein